MIKAVFVGLVLVVAVPAAGQDAPLWSYLGAAGADWASTATALSAGARGTNQSLAFTRSHPAGTVAAGAAEDVAIVWLAYRLLAKRHPAWLRAGLYAASGWRVWLTVSNVRNYRECVGRVGRTC